MVSINFNKKLYKLSAIRSTIKAYKNLASFDLKESKKDYRLTLKNIDKDVEPIIKDEFCNYVLYLMKAA